MQRWLNRFGIALLLLAALASIIQVTWRAKAEANPQQITIRICHWQLESGLREAYDEVARAYMALHPNVKIVQLPVPGRFYGTYTATQIVGDDPPDLIQLGSNLSDAALADYYVPLSRYVEEPNPYNKGTPLEGVAWRDTFKSGLARAPGVDRMMEYFAVPSIEVTGRMYCNLPLYEKIMGHRNPPKTYREFLDVCERANAYAKTHQLKLMPIAGSRFNANVLLDRLFRSQTQKLALQRDPLDTLSTPSLLAFVGNRTSLDDPAIRSGMAIMREVAGYMSPGFMQFDRDDAIFHFGQGRALMIMTGSWDYGSIVNQSNFEIGVFDMPVPGPEDPVYGPYTLGPTTESGVGAGGGLGLTNASPNRETAVDFIRFLTSVRGNQLFVNRAKWLPSVRYVEVPSEVRAFAQRADGYPDGFAIAPIMWGSGEVYRLQSNNLHLLFDREGSVQKFADAMQPGMANAVAADLTKQVRGYRDNVARFDAEHAALLQLPPSTQRLSQLRELQTAQEVHWLWLLRESRPSAKGAN